MADEDHISRRVLMRLQPVTEIIPRHLDGFVGFVSRRGQHEARGHLGVTNVGEVFPGFVVPKGEMGFL